jgi:hypothetical protein
MRCITEVLAASRKSEARANSRSISGIDPLATYVPLRENFLSGFFVGDKLHYRIAGCPLLAHSGHAICPI